MRTHRFLALGATSALLALPGVALATRPADKPAKPAKPTPAQAKAYGKYCKGESKQHVKGQKGTPFSQCVQAMAKLDKGDTTTTTENAKKAAKAACKPLSKKHVKGQKGTPYSQCIVAAAHLQRDETKS